MSNIISFFQKLIKGGGVGIRTGGLNNFSKINKRGDDYSVLERTGCPRKNATDLIRASGKNLDPINSE